MDYKKIAYFTPIPFHYSGRIVEYFIKNTEDFYLYLYTPSYKNQPSLFEHYRKGKLLESEELWLYRGNNKVFIHIFYFYYYIYILSKYKIRDSYIIFHFPIFLFFNSIIGFFTKNTYVFWIWDYFPNHHGIMKYYNMLVKHYNDSLKHAIYLSPAIRNVYNSKKPVKKNEFDGVITLGLKNIKVTRKPIKNMIGYIGNLRHGQGLEFLLDVVKKNPKLKLQIAGEGYLKQTLEDYIEKNKLQKHVEILGFVEKEKLSAIMSKWEVGAAPYATGKENPIYYTDAGKIKVYVQYEIPVIMTRVSYFYKELIKYNAGIGINLTTKSFVEALLKIQKHYRSYTKGVVSLKKINQFEPYYHKRFTFLQTNKD